MPITQVKNELASLGVQGHEIKLTRYGTKLFANTNEQFKKIKSHFSKNKSEYTHTLIEDQTNKFVIHGLHDMDITEITKELILNEINPCNVKKIQIKKPKQDEQTLFLVYFKRDQQTKISELRTIRSLCQIRIRWEYYRNRQTGPMQCNNCMNFGHGALNCHIKSRCVRCGENHASKMCPHILKTSSIDNKIPIEDLKCANCNGNHNAKFIQCPKRIEYIKAMENIRKRNKTTPPKQFQYAPELNNAQFPMINLKTLRPWSQAANNPTTSSKPKSSRAFSNKSSENELFSTAELIIIIKEILSKLSLCSTKADQFQVIAELACTHLYGK